MSASSRLLTYLSSFRCQPLAIPRVVDAKKRLAQSFDPDFPLIVRFYSFPAYREMLGANWLNWCQSPAPENFARANMSSISVPAISSSWTI
jgi:hypothetical protein